MLSIDINTGDTNVTWKRSFQGSEPIVRSENGEILALSAFLLSTLPSPVARKTLLKEIWESGADIIVSARSMPSISFPICSSFLVGSNRP